MPSEGNRKAPFSAPGFPPCHLRPGVSRLRAHHAAPAAGDTLYRVEATEMHLFSAPSSPAASRCQPPSCPSCSTCSRQCHSPSDRRPVSAETNTTFHFKIPADEGGGQHQQASLDGVPGPAEDAVGSITATVLLQTFLRKGIVLHLDLQFFISGLNAAQQLLAQNQDSRDAGLTRS